MEIRTLTSAETEIMKILWKLGKAFVRDILDQMPEPKPAYTTVSTFIRILEKKNVIGHKTYGNTHEYFPLVSEEAYKHFEIQQLMVNYFDNSAANLVSFFVNNKNLKDRELDEILKFIQDNKEQK